jgi:aminoglycoside phosphotransferase (APT) family kinase protein
MPVEDISLIARIVVDVIGSPVTAVRPIIGRGSVNKVYIAEASGVRYVARLGTEHGIAQYRKEAWCSLQADELGIPGPVVLGVGETASTAYMLLSYVPGVAGDDVGVDKARLWYALGTYAKRIHSIAVTGFGDRLADPMHGRFSDTWDRYLTYNIVSLTDQDALLALGVFSTAESRRIRLVFESLRVAPLRFGLSHGDLAPRNTIVDAMGRVYLLDWGSAEARVVPHHDIAQIQGDSLTSPSPWFDAFLIGYGLTRDEFAALQPEIEAVALLRAIDLARWALDRSPENIPRCVAQARAMVQSTLARLR